MVVLRLIECDPLATDSCGENPKRALFYRQASIAAIGRKGRREIHRVVNQEEAASLLGSYFDAWYPPLVRYAYGVTGDLNLAEDLVQELFLRLYSELRGGKTIGNAKAWMFCVLRHDIGREWKRRASEVANTELADSRARTVPPATLAEECDPGVELDEVSHLLSVLTTREQEVMLLRMASLKYREIADRLDISTSAVNTLLARAVRKLRQAARRRSAGFPTNVVRPIPKTLQ